MLQTQLPGSQQALVAADDGLVFFSGDDGVNQPELMNRPGERLQFLVTDATRVGWVGAQVFDWKVSNLN